MQEKIEKKKRPSKFNRSNTFGKPKKRERISYFKPEIAPALKSVLAQIGKPYPTPFVPDEFQVKALEAIKKNTSPD